ncbi:MAG: isochorismatase family protein [Spirochaetales bacterium]|nr:isochorismatase family protein [Spirochaetales bacterium]
MKNTALLIVDVQAWLFQRQDPVYKEEILMENIKNLEQFARKNNVPIVYIQHESSGAMKRNSADWQLHKGLHPRSDDIFIGKKKGNSFFETPLHNILQEKGIKKVLICGLLSQCCILKTTLGALELEYETILVSDAHSNSGTYPEKNITKVHKTIEKAGGLLIPIKDLAS